MTPDIYYHILEIGFSFEKGRKVGDRWRFGEKKRLLDECRLWKNLIQYAASEEKGKDCSDMAFAGLEEICRKHKIKNYERIIALRSELEASLNRFETDETDRKKLIDRMFELISVVEKSTEARDGKADAYRALQALHNIPRALHGNDALGTAVPITCAEAMKSSALCGKL